MSVLVSAEELHERIHRGDKLTLLATTWVPGQGNSFRQFRAGHIPTAQHVNPATTLAGLPGSKAGRNPLPDPVRLQANVNRWGLRGDRPVVVYDDGQGFFAGRAWWVLRWAGIKNVSILDGGLAQWYRKGFDTMCGPGNIAMGSALTIQPGSMPSATIDEVRNFDGTLVDTRSFWRYSGKQENLDLKAGHIPGAVNASMRDLLTPNRLAKPKEEIREVFAKAGVTKGESTVFYSGSGNHSGLALALAEHVGLTGASHYVGGWSQWSANAANPVETSR